MAKKGLTAQQKLEQAYFELLEGVHYSKITVSDIITKAGVSRTTFYRHYVDVFDMYDKICKHIIDNLFDGLAVIFQRDVPVNLTQLVDGFAAKLESQKKYILLLCSENGNRAFFEYALAAVLSYPEKSGDYFTKNEMFVLKFIALSGIGAYVKSVMDGVEFPPAFLEISKFFLNMEQRNEEQKNG